MEWKYKLIIAYKRFEKDELQVEVRKFLTEKRAKSYKRQTRQSLKNLGFIDKGIELIKL